MSGQSGFAAALLDAGLPCPDGLLAWNGSDPARRFAVYRNNVVVSLVDALAEAFPVVHALVGGEFFRAMAQVFVTTRPPRSCLLAFYGEGFADFVAAFPPAAELPWLADVARLEMLRVRACHAADAEALPQAALGALLADPARLPGAGFGLHPALGVLRSAHAVVDLWAAHQVDAPDLSGLDPARPQAALVMREQDAVTVTEISVPAAAFIECLQAGANLGEALDACSAHGGFDLSAALGVLLRAQAIVSIREGDKDHE
ncbi:MAG: DNA-binding domain-containing protein [Thauera sp.]|nr:DNA-binding domain-containing protein [Thauera sp.]